MYLGHIYAPTSPMASSKMHPNPPRSETLKISNCEANCTWLRALQGGPGSQGSRGSGFWDSFLQSLEAPAKGLPHSLWFAGGVTTVRCHRLYLLLY